MTSKSIYTFLYVILLIIGWLFLFPLVKLLSIIVPDCFTLFYYMFIPDCSTVHFMSFLCDLLRLRLFTVVAPSNQNRPYNVVTYYFYIKYHTSIRISISFHFW